MSSRVRGVALVALLLLSAVAGVAAAETRTPAAVAVERVDATAQVAGQATGPDAGLRSGNSFWEGWQLRLDLSGVLAGSSGDRTFEVWRVTEDGRLNQQVRTFEVDESGTHVLDTGGLEGRFVVRYAGDPVYFDDGSGSVESTADGSAVTVGNAAFRVAPQTLSFDWSDPTVYPGQRVSLSVESNRAASTVAVSAEGVSFDELAATFPASSFASDHDARADRDVLLVSLEGTTTLDLNTSALSPGTGPLVFDVVDTATRETAALTVLEPASDRRFRSIEHHEHAGDVVEADLACGHCFVVVGGPGQGLLDVVEVRDEDGDGTVALRINTRYAGMDTSAPGYPSGVEVYTAPGDSAERYSPNADLEAVRESLNYDVTTLSDLRKEQGLASAGRDRPVGPGEYRLTVTSSDYVIDRSAYGSVPPLGADLVVRDESDVATVTLEPPALDGAEALAAPVAAGFEVTAESLRTGAGARESVALGDRLVFRFDGAGLFGYLHARGETLGTLLDAEEEGVAISLERVVDASRGVTELVRLERTESQLVADPARDSLYLVVRTGGTSPSRLGAGEYRATLSLKGVPDRYERYSTRDGHGGYPYLDPGGTESVSATATLVEPAASIGSPEPGAPAYLTPAGALEVGGTTTVAPGTTLTVVTSATEFAWGTETRTTVRADGSWTAAPDLAGAPGESFEVVVQRGRAPLATRTLDVLPAPDDGTPAAGEGDAGSGGEGSSSDDGGQAGTSGSDGMSVAGVPLPDVSGLVSLAVPIGGGVGAIAFFWGAWRLVFRRLIL